MAIIDGIKKRMWNAFRYEEQVNAVRYVDHGPASSHKPDRTVLRYTNEKSIISSILTRLSIDVAALDLRHIETDEQGRYLADAESALNGCFTIEANIDQAPRAFKQDIVLTMFDEGVAVVTPIDAWQQPDHSEVMDIKTMRVASVVSWHPKHVRINVYNEELGKRQDITVHKRFAAIVENPLYSVMNEPNSTLKRLQRKLNLLDVVDEASSSGKLDIIIQLPYAIKTESKKQQAEQRREDMEWQLKGSQYGIAYADATEKITQLNRPAENNLLNQVQYLTNMLYGQLGLTEEVMNGTADEPTMRNYFNRTIEPIITAITEAMTRSFLGATRYRQGERIKYFDNPFKLVPIKDLAEIADKFVRNEVLTPNELRDFMGLKPSKDPKSDTLANPNMPQPEETSETETSERTERNGS